MNSLYTVLQENSYVIVGGDCVGRNFNNNIGPGCMRILPEEYAYF
jgi:hypothetical protein